MPQLSLHGPLGSLTLSEEDEGLVSLDWGWGGDQQQTLLLRRARDQVQSYFDQQLRCFDLPLAPQGSRFQKSVWAAIARIPFGATCTCSELGKRLGADFRTVGMARTRNPLPILIPSHRLVETGRLGSSAAEGGATTKRFLLDLERND
ncbi:methylated-DNA--[protein]-cysteine S-methyltransferase [Lichenicoccus sp.]|uniref:methylated-DNA--[protein]-cysteine S-methyltransferase n=1 Tax=Lichenicoccus sp. TaxID=2781899 RepID=UPI003D0F399F